MGPKYNAATSIEELGCTKTYAGGVNLLFLREENFLFLSLYIFRTHTQSTGHYTWGVENTLRSLKGRL